MDDLPQLRYRSLLEKRWDAMFNLLGIEPDYEYPLDFPNNGENWLPDWILPGDPPLLVEAKGVAGFQDMDSHAEILRAKRKANSIGLTLVAVGPKPVKTEEGVLFGVAFQPRQIPTKAFLDLDFGTKGFVNVTVRTRYDVLYQSTSEAFRESELAHSDKFSANYLWRVAQLQSRWNPKKGTP